MRMTCTLHIAWYGNTLFLDDTTPCRLDRVFTIFMAAVESAVDAGVTRCGRAYIAAAAILISLVTAVYFAAVIPEASFRFPSLLSNP